MCLPLCGFGLGFEMSQARESAVRTDAALRDPPSLDTLGRGRRGCWAAQSRHPSLAHVVHTRPRIPRGEPVCRALAASRRKCQPHFSKPLPASPGTLSRPSVSSQAVSVVRAGSTPGGPPVGACDSGLSQAEAGCQPIHWATRNLTLLFIGSAMAGPAWREEVAALASQGNGGGDSRTRMKPGLITRPRLPRGFPGEESPGPAVPLLHGQGGDRPGNTARAHMTHDLSLGLSWARKGGWDGKRSAERSSWRPGVLRLGPRTHPTLPILESNLLHWSKTPMPTHRLAPRWGWCLGLRKLWFDT